MADAPAKAKRQKHGGRAKGTPNKLTGSVKAALHEAFDALGGVKSLVAWGRDNPSDFYKLWGRLVPQEVNNTHAGEMRVECVQLPAKDKFL